MPLDEQPNSPLDAGSPSAQTSGAGMSSDVERQIERALQEATTPPKPVMRPGAPELGAAPGAPRAIRGPRVVQAGREHRTGRIVSIGPTDVFLEFGPRELGVTPRIQWPDDTLPRVGEEIQVVVDRYEPNEQLFICSRPGAVQKAAWELLEAGQVVEARVTGVNKGGLELEVAGHRAFMPAGRVDIRHIPDLGVFVGEKLTVKITQVDRSGRGNILLSRRELLAEEAKAAKEKLREKLKEGEVLEGVVKKIMAFGAFVDIGGIDGLVHISDLAHDRVRRVEDHVKEGQTVTVKVLKLDWDNDRLSLGIKQVMADPFQTAAKDIQKDAIVSGRVTKLLEFGCFVEVAPGIEGLVHISEIAWRRIGVPGDVVKVDEVVQVRVLEVDPERRRISLSIKQASENPTPPAAEAGADRSAKLGARQGGGQGGGYGGRGGGGGRGGNDGAFSFGRKGRRGEEKGRSLEEIEKDKQSPAFRRMKEQALAKQKSEKSGLKSGLGDVGSIGLGDLGKLTLG